jgi:demethylspheroidene O-methyltransferase
VAAAHHGASIRGTSWRETWFGALNRLIASPRFQNWAARSPLTRAIARRRARALFDLCAGFVYSQVLQACVRLDLFEYLRQGPRTVEAISAHTGLSSEAARRLSRAATSLRLMREWPDSRFGLDELGAALLGNPAISALIEHHGLLYDDLRDPVGLLERRSPTRLSGFWPYSDDASNGADFKGYSALMSRTQPLVAEDILDAYPIARHNCLLDVGGGEGAFVAACAARAPRLKLKLFDLPSVAERARAWLSENGLVDRVEIHGGSFARDSLPPGADLITLIRVLHDQDDESSMELLRSAWRALPPGGAVLVAEPMSGAAGAEPIGDAYFGIYLWAMGQGRPRAPREVEDMLHAAGFAKVRILKTRRPMLASAVIGWRA